MKKLLIALAMVAATSGVAHAHNYGHHYPRHHNNNWIGPAVGGILLGAVIANSQSYRPVTVYPSQYVAPVTVYPSQPAIIYPTQPAQQYYGCLVQVYDPITNSYRNEPRTCIR